MKSITKYIAIAVLWFSAAGLTGRRAAAASLEADMVIFNGKILTADNPDPNSFRTVQAAAIQAGKFIAVGSNEEAMQYAGEKTKKIDLGGRMVFPGIVESHQHLYRNNYIGHWLAKDAPRPEETDPPIAWSNKEDFLGEVHTLALKHKPGEWILVTPRGAIGGMYPALMRGDVTIADLDKAAPNNPVQIHWGLALEGLVNSKALKPLLDRYPNIPGVHRDAKGKPTGRLSGSAEWVPSYELWPLLPPEYLGPIYKKEMDEAASQGMTTFSSRQTPNDVSVYQWLHARNEMPLRMGYTQEITHTLPGFVESYLVRLKGLQGGAGKNLYGAGDDIIWMIGMGPGSVDYVAGVAGACDRKAYPRENINFPLWKDQFYGPYGLCRMTDPAYNDMEILRSAVKYGYRLSGLHVGGDKGIDQLLDLMDEMKKDYPDIVERRWSADHCELVHEDQIKRAATLGFGFSCGATFLYGGEKGAVGAFKAIYGEEEAANAVIPFRSMIDNHVLSVIELDSHGFHPFLALQTVITRRDINGKVWGPQQAITRKEALYAYTRWSSQYVLKENAIGSIEPNKLADFVVLNRDYLTIPENEIGRMDALLTVMGGDITYSEPGFAASQGLPVLGYQGDKSFWLRGGPEDAKRGQAGQSQ